MTSKAFLLLQSVINAAWECFTGWHIPGTALTPAAFIFFCMAAGLSLKVLVSLFTGVNDNESTFISRTYKRDNGSVTYRRGKK